MTVRVGDTLYNFIYMSIQKIPKLWSILHEIATIIIHILISREEIDPSEVDQLTAATTLALQRMQLYQEDAGEANTLTKPTRSSGSKDGFPQNKIHSYGP